MRIFHPVLMIPFLFLCNCKERDTKSNDPEPNNTTVDLSWSSIDAGIISGDVANLKFANQLEGYCMVQAGQHISHLLKTSDGGSNWDYTDLVQTPLYDVAVQGNGIYCLDIYDRIKTNLTKGSGSWTTTDLPFTYTRRLLSDGSSIYVITNQISRNNSEIYRCTNAFKSHEMKGVTRGKIDHIRSAAGDVIVVSNPYEFQSYNPFIYRVTSIGMDSLQVVGHGMNSPKVSALALIDSKTGYIGIGNLIYKFSFPYEFNLYKELEDPSEIIKTLDVLDDKLYAGTSKGNIFKISTDLLTTEYSIPGIQIYSANFITSYKTAYYIGDSGKIIKGTW